MAKHTILLVEDDETLAAMYQLKLEAAGYKVDVVHSGPACLTYISRKRPSLIVLDILLPKLNGFQVLKEMRKLKTMSSTPIIILTNLVEADVNMSRELAVSLGVSDYLVKSKVTPDEVVARVGLAVGSK